MSRMTIFTSRTAESYDPKPYRNTADGSRWPDDGGDPILLPYDPRPEFEPTRDGAPFFLVRNNGFKAQVRLSIPEYRALTLAFQANYMWTPRDRNRNRILIAFRKRGTALRVWLTQSDDYWRTQGYSIAEIEHARKVLTHLANVYGVDA